MASKTTSRKYPRIYDEMRGTLLDERIIHLYGPIQPATSCEIIMLLSYLEHKSNKPITLYMNTGGGCVLSAFTINNRIEMTKKKGIDVNIIAIGACMSAGNIVLQAATRRMATPNTSFLLHDVSSVTYGTTAQQEDARREHDRIREQVFTIMGRTGLTRKQLIKMTDRKDFYFGVDHAVKIGLIDGIVG